MENTVEKSELASLISGLTLSSGATQKVIRETLQTLISALKSVAGVVCLAFMTMFWTMDAEGAITGTTKWEDVNPSTEMNELVELANDDRLTIAQYEDGRTLITNIVGTI